MSSMPDWVVAARKYVALKRPEFLEEARQACPDDAIREFLGREDLTAFSSSEETLSAFNALQERLVSEGREVEAAILRLVFSFPIAAAAVSPERVDAETAASCREVCNHLLEVSREHGFGECEAFFAAILGTGAGKRHRWPEARGLLAHACKLYRELAKVEPPIYRPYVATTLNNLGTVLGNERDFPGARAACEEARDIYRALAEDDPRIYRHYVAMALVNLGNVLRDERDFAGARAAYEEARDIYRELAKVEPRICRPDVAMALNNLGNVLRDERDFPGARAAYEEARDIYRELAKVEPRIYRPYVATTLVNLGTVLHDERDFPGARAAYEEARDIYRELPEGEPHIYRPFVAGTLNNLAGVLAEVGEGEEAGRVAAEAVEAAEGVEENVALAKGNAARAYGLLLGALVEAGEEEVAFRCMAAMREGPLRALDQARGADLGKTTDKLRRVEEAIGRPVRILFAQSVGDGQTVLAVVSSDEKNRLVACRVDNFQEPATALYGEIGKVFRKEKDDPPPPTYEQSRRAVSEAGRRAWECLPDVIREVLDPAEPAHVLVSGDRFWNAFPWEALLTGPGEDDWLGLGRPLVRWGPLSAAALGRLGKRPFGDGELTGAVVCPWNVPREDELFRAKEEAPKVARQLAGLGYTTVPDGGPVIGPAATRAAMREVLDARPTVIHYTGHGAIVGNEEVLWLWPEAGGERGLPFGRKELSDLAAARGVGRLAEQGPLVVLNSCMTGGTRDHGGQREDLAAALIDHGAEAVVGCALPVFDTMGMQLGKQLFRSVGVGETGLGGDFAWTRATIESIYRECESRLWAAWTLLHYHGNPYAELRVYNADEEKRRIDDAHAEEMRQECVEALLQEGGFSAEDAKAAARRVIERLRGR